MEEDCLDWGQRGQSVSRLSPPPHIKPKTKFKQNKIEIETDIPIIYRETDIHEKDIGFY